MSESKTDQLYKHGIELIQSILNLQSTYPEPPAPIRFYTDGCGGLQFNLTKVDTGWRAHIEVGFGISRLMLSVLTKSWRAGMYQMIAFLEERLVACPGQDIPAGREDQPLSH